MSKVELLNSAHHGELKVESGIKAKFDDYNPLVQVAADELPKLVLDFPVFITKNPNTGEFELSALMGFSAGENLFLNGENWGAAYIPLDLRRQPFQALIVESDGEPTSQLKIGLNVESKRISDAGQALFNGSSEPTEFLEEVSKMLSVLTQGLQRTNTFLKSLLALDLIEPVKLRVQLEGENKLTFDGLYTVHAEKLNQLDEAEVTSLHKRGYLQACYAVIHSLGHMDKLIAWRAKLKT